MDKDEEEEQEEVDASVARPPKPDLSMFARFDYDFERVQHEQQLTAALMSSILMSASKAGGADFPEGVQRIVNSYAATVDLITIQIRGVAARPAATTQANAFSAPDPATGGANAVVILMNHKSDEKMSPASEDIINVLVPRAAFQWTLSRDELLFPALTETITRLHPAATKYELRLNMATKPMPNIMKYVIHQCNSRSK